jgi:hypothetical protein
VISWWLDTNNFLSSFVNLVLHGPQRSSRSTPILIIASLSRKIPIPEIRVYPTQSQMRNPVIDSSYEEKQLQACLDPSRPAAPAVAPSGSSGKMEPAVSQDVAVLFDPLGLIPTSSRVTQVPAMVPTNRATPKAAYDPGSRPERQTNMLTILTPMSPPLSLGNTLDDLLGTRDKHDAGPRINSRTKPTRQFSTTPPRSASANDSHPSTCTPSFYLFAPEA